MGYHVYLWHGPMVCWHLKTWFESGPVTADLTNTVIHVHTRNYKLLINDIHSNTQSQAYTKADVLCTLIDLVS